MKIIVGLGNPGKEYENTRHNAGFMFLDQLAQRKELIADDVSAKFTMVKKFEAEIADINREGERIILVKPQTFMNLSGKAVAALVNYYKANLEDLIVINDDLDLPVGHIRIRKGGSSAGQKGLQNIIDSLGSDKFTRFRIGISANGEIMDRIDTVNFVLSKFSDREKPVLEHVIGDGVEYLMEHLKDREGIPAHSIEVVGKEI